MSDADTIGLTRYLETRCDERSKQYEIHVQRLEEAIALESKSVTARFAWIEKRTAEVREALEARLGTMDKLRAEFDAELQLLRESRARIDGAASRDSVNRMNFVAWAAVVMAAVGIILDFLHN